MPDYLKINPVYMKKYETLEHLADLKIRVWANTRKELFCNALTAMFESIEPELDRSQERERVVQMESKDKDLLLVDFLSEALYLSDVNNEAYVDADIEELEDRKIRARLKGYAVRGFKEEIKAVTYHGFKIEKIDGGLRAEIIFDI